MQIGMSMSIPSVVRTLPMAVRSILAKYPAGDAHLYLPAAQTPVLGPELVVNGDGSSTTGWLSSGTFASVGGELQVTTTGGFGWMRQVVPATVGKTYRVSFDFRRVTGSSGYVNVRDSSNAISYGQQLSTGTFNQLVTLTAGTGIWIQTENYTNGDVMGLDNISVREILSYSDTISGFHTGNYLDSAGTTPATVDNPVGLVLDGAGSVGSELKDTFSAGSGVTKVGDTYSGTSVGTFDTIAVKSSGLAIGKTYKITYTVNSISGGSIRWMDTGGTGHTAGSVGTYTFHYTIGIANLTLQTMAIGVAFNVTVTSVREVTGIHASQSTAGFKPVERRGIVNLLTYSNDLTNASWTKFGTASVTGSVVSLPALADRVYKIQSGCVSGSTYTVGYVLSGSGTVKIGANNSVADETVEITLTATPTLYVKSYTAQGTTTYPYAVYRDGTTATSVTVESVGLFQGTLTASQILSYGGIPLTTTAAASSSGGNYFWQFDGTDDRISLGAPLFQMSDDHCVVAGVTGTAASSGRPIFAGWNTGGVSAFINLYHNAGNYYAAWKDDASAYYAISYAVPVGTPVVPTLRKVGNNKSLRINGSQVAINTAAIGTGTIAQAAIGQWQYGASSYDYFQGNIGPMVIIKGTVSDADLLVLERFVASLSGVTL
jgi:hypothetical protein